MDKSIELPRFVEEKRFKTMSVFCAQYSRDGKALAVVYYDFTLSIWDSSDLMTETREIFEYYPELQSHRDITNAGIFLDWSASSRYLYYVVDRKGVMIDVFSPDKNLKIMIFDQVLLSFSCHPFVDELCLACSQDTLIEINIKTDCKQKKINYQHLNSAERKSKTAVYAQYTGVNNTILLWVKGYVHILDENGSPLIEYKIKPCPPGRQRIYIDIERKQFAITSQKELYVLSITQKEEIRSYRDHVNESSWGSLSYFQDEELILAVPTNYVTEGPVFYILTGSGKLEVSIFREPRQILLWGEVHPSGRTILFSTEVGELIQFRRESDEFQWHGPMYPYNFTYLKKSEPGVVHDNEEFISTYFPRIHEHGKLEAHPTHTIDINNPINKETTRFVVDLVPGDEEKSLTYNEDQLPPMLDDLFGSLFCVCLNSSHFEFDPLIVLK